MRYLRYNIASILGAILFVAVGTAALRESNEPWDSGLFSLTLGLLLVSVLLAVHRTEVRRAFWIGFALFGWGYLGLSLVPPIESRLISTKVLAYIDSKVLEQSTPIVKTVVFSGTHPLVPKNEFEVDIIFDGPQLATSNSGVVRVWDAATGNLFRGWRGTTENRVRIGHALVALLAAWLGGLLSRRLGRVSVATRVSVAEGAAG